MFVGLFELSLMEFASSALGEVSMGAKQWIKGFRMMVVKEYINGCLWTKQQQYNFRFYKL